MTPASVGWGFILLPAAAPQGVVLRLPAFSRVSWQGAKLGEGEFCPCRIPTALDIHTVTISFLTDGNSGRLGVVRCPPLCESPTPSRTVGAGEGLLLPARGGGGEGGRIVSAAP